MTDRARELIQQVCEAALADFRCYQSGRNVPQDVANIQASLARHLIEHPIHQPGWQRIPVLAEHLLELYTSQPVGYLAFVTGISPGDDPNPMEVLWQMDWAIGCLSDDHDFVLWGEPGEQVLMYQDDAPSWTRGCRPDDVVVALEARRARIGTTDKPAARKAPRP